MVPCGSPHSLDQSFGCACLSLKISSENLQISNPKRKPPLHPKKEKRIPAFLTVRTHSTLVCTNTNFSYNEFLRLLQCHVGVCIEPLCCNSRNEFLRLVLVAPIGSTPYALVQLLSHSTPYALVQHVRARCVSSWGRALWQSWGERKRFGVVCSYPYTILISAGTQSRSVAFALWYTILKR